MKSITHYFLLFLMISSIVACSSSRKKQFDSKTAHHERVAVLPLQSKIKLTEKQKASMSTPELEKLELAQGREVQEAVESYLVNKRLRVTIQSANLTNSKLRDSRIDIKNIQDQDFTKLANILGVDAVVGGYIETEKPMTEALATGLDIAKGLERSLLGTNFGGGVNTSTNRGMCRLSLFDGVNGDRLWSYNEDIELSKGSTTQDMINNLMRQGARQFPYKAKK